METPSIPFQLAADFINYTNRSLFLTGKAGTGKTTFLKYIKQNTTKQTAVLAPTGVAAINAGGVTIHSFFQLPFTPFIPGHKGLSSEFKDAADKHSLLSRIKLNTERRKLLRQLELLIIDEISMVRCDVMDAIDIVLRHFRSRNGEPFGGVQVLLIGDMYQLPPVAPDEEWQLLSQFYSSPYFFSSRVMEQQPAYIELDKIYRQSDAQFIHLLNQVRNNEMDEDGMQLLHSRYQPAFQPSKDDGSIILTTHNYKADATNADELMKLKGGIFSFKAVITGEFYEKSYPADENLQLKVGAQVMFIKNDLEKVRRYFNGKIGTVEKIETDKIFIRCKDETDAIEVKKEVWKNIRYTLNKTTQHIEEDELGSFTQYPLRLAWAITIHKSQGLTFEKAVIDAGAAFAPGQVYVALSRCTSLLGLVLSSRINARSLHSDERIVQFAQNKIHSSQLQHELIVSKHHYQGKIIKTIFDFSSVIKNCGLITGYAEEYASSFNTGTIPWLKTLQEKIEALQDVAQKFQPQLQQLMQQDVLPESNIALQQRITAAAKYFSVQLKIILDFIVQSPAVTDSKIHALQYNENLKEIYTELALKKQLIEACENGFSTEAYHQQKNNFILPPFNINAHARASAYKKIDSPHPLLHRNLRILRDGICNEEDAPLYMVAGTATIDEMARYLPQTLNELSQISGFGKVKTGKYGQRFLNVIIAYCTEQKLSSLIHEKISKRKRKEETVLKTDTKLETFRLYKEGKTVAAIAAHRNFAPQTIEGHLAHFVQTGEIKIDELVSREKLILIEPAVKNFDGGSITPVKQQLDDSISFGEIKLVIAWMEYEKSRINK